MAQRAEAEARRWLGTPYRHQASLAGVGCDCLGLLRGVWRQLYGYEPDEIPAYPADLRRDPDPGQLLCAAERLLRPAGPAMLPGNVVLFRLVHTLPPRHCGIATQGHRFIHAQEGLGVVEAPLSLSWQRRLAGVYAFAEIEDA